MAIRKVAARLRVAYPWVDVAIVEAAVGTAYGSFSQARVRTYVPILVERRARAVIGAACRAADAEAADGGVAVQQHGAADHAAVVEAEDTPALTGGGERAVTVPGSDAGSAHRDRREG
ncbi:hypothetical protein [Streptomyces sp. NPDC002133]|uniref:three-helix bundle dimerization domain-containing protein n=1 Tax=Streptomyces sp. NPDC002133 TaxID=3154409 RepID=UPI00331CC723